MYERFLTISALVLGMAVAVPSVAFAQGQVACGERDSVVAKLGEKYGEVRRGGGLAGATAIFEVWASDATGTWTILKTTPNGQACVMAVGEGWQDGGGAATAVGSPV
jgi:hypothetical protein